MSCTNLPLLRHRYHKVTGPSGTARDAHGACRELVHGASEEVTVAVQLAANWNEACGRGRNRSTLVTPEPRVASPKLVSAIFLGRSSVVHLGVGASHPEDTPER